VRYVAFAAFLAICALVWGCSNGPSPANADPDDAVDRDAQGVSSVEKSGADDRSADPSREPTEEATGAEAEEPPDEQLGEEAEPIRTPEELAKALAEKNPEFDGEVDVQPVDARTMAVTIKDRNLVDIGPLSRFRVGEFRLVLDLSGCDITDLRPLKGMPLVALFMEGNDRLTDIEPLRGMRLIKLYLSDTRIANLGPLRRAPLQEVNLVRTRVDDVSPLSESPITMLWLSECPVKDISPLKTTPLVSLTVENTPVDDISPFQGHPIQRLHIGGTQVTDLTPVSRMRLTRLIFTPGKIEKGLEHARNMPTLREIGTTFQEKMPPPVFWQAYDAGKIK
jgi:hypothetical protein